MTRSLRRSFRCAVGLAVCGAVGFSACGGPPERSVENYCDRLTSETDRLSDKYESRAAATSDDPLAGLFVATVSAVEAMGDLATLTESLSEVAPEEVRLEHEVVSRNLRSQIDSTASAGSSPFGAIFSSFVMGAADNGSFLVVDQFAQDNCGIQLFGSARITTEQVADSDGNVSVRNVAPTFDDTGDLLAGTDLVANSWVTRTAGLTCAGGSGGYTYSDSDLRDIVGGFKASLRLYWSDSTPTPGLAHQETVDECGWGTPEEIEVDGADLVDLRAHRYGDIYRAYLSDGDVLVVLHYAVNEIPDEGRFADVASQIARNLVGAPSPTTDDNEPPTPDQADLLVRSDGIIELAPVANKTCEDQDNQTYDLLWAGPEQIIVFCHRSEFGDRDNAVSLHSFNLTSLQRQWSYTADGSVWYDDSASVTGSADLVALSVPFEIDAEGVTAGEEGWRLIVLSAETGEIVMDEPYPGDDLSLAHRVHVVGGGRVWTDSFRGPVYFVDPATSSFTEYKGAIFADTSADSDNLAVFGNGVLVQNPATDQLELLDISSGEFLAATNNIQRDLCDTRRPIQGGQYTTVDGETGAMPDAAAGGYGLDIGWLILDGDVYLINVDGSERWRIDADALSYRTYEYGLLQVTNTNGESYEVDLATGEILRPIDSVVFFGSTVPGAAFTLAGTDLVPLPRPACS